jgi:hypothetical protein
MGPKPPNLALNPDASPAALARRPLGAGSRSSLGLTPCSLVSMLAPQLIALRAACRWLASILCQVACLVTRRGLALHGRSHRALHGCSGFELGAAVCVNCADGLRFAQRQRRAA